MSGFGNFARTAHEVEQEMLKRGVLMGLDWSDATRLRQLAREALGGGPVHIAALLRDTDPALRAKGQLFALAALMLRTMDSSARTGVHTHGGPAWKAFGRALYEEAQAAGLESAAHGLADRQGAAAVRR